MVSEIFSYAFLTRAFIVGLMVSVSSSLLGVSLVLRKTSMMGDGLSHVAFGSLALATAFSIAPMVVTIPVVVAAAFILVRVSERGSGDRSVALLSSSALAIGVIAVSVGGVNTDLNAFLFGSIVSVTEGDAVISLISAVLTVVIYVIFYHRIYASIFDPAFARASGIKCSRYGTLLAVLTAVMVVVGMRILGSLLISSLIIFPAAIALKTSKTYFAATVTAVAESAVAFVAGFLVSYAFSLPTGAAIVTTHLVFLIAVTVGKACFKFLF